MDGDKVVVKQVTSGTKVEAIGTVKTVVGEVKAIDPSGNERILQAGDKVYPNETIMTAVGALVLIEFVNGTHLDLPSSSQIILDTDVFDPSLAKAATGELTAEQIQEMIARGEDPTAVTEATAAGAGAGDEGGSSFVVVDFNNTEGQVTSGFNTLGIPGPESTTFTELPPVEDEPVALPVISVSVNVDIEIGEGSGEPGPDGVIYIPGGTPISGGVSGVDVIEGSDGFMHTVSFVITLSEVATQPVTITYTIIPDSATYGSGPDGDFFDGSLTKTVTIPAGYIGFVVTENIVADIKVESDETFRIVLSNPINATLVNDTATVTIVDDDMNPVANNDTNWVQEDAFDQESESITTSGNVLLTVAHPDDPSETLSFTDTADADDNPLILTWGSETAAHGSIVKNPDGTYTYTLNNGDPEVQGLSDGETLTETFTYTITDGVNTPDTGTLSITIFGSDDGVVIRGIGALGGDETVLENDLSVGSSPNAGALTQTGSFDIVALDGVATVNVGGTVLTITQLQSAATFPVAIDTPYGTLTLTGYSGDVQGGTIGYSYALDSTVDNDSQSGATNGNYIESVGVTVTDEDGSFADSSVNINIVDDIPTAANDGPAGVTEDGTSFVSGNVLTNDASGADVSKVFDSWSATGHDNTASVTELTKYGSLVQNGDGSWSYTLNNADADTQALTAASSLSYDLWYTMKDADGDTSPAKLTITITGANDNASVVTASASGPDNTVQEAGLNPNGSNAGSTSETSTGSFTVTATDGILNIVIGGTSYTLAQMQAFNGTQTVNTGEGVLTLTGYSGTATSGTVSYSYTVSATIDNDSKAGATGTEFDDSVVLTVNGVGGSTASDDLVVRIVDDLPQVTTTGSLSGLIVDETNLAFNDTDSFAGAFSFTYGADGAAAVGAKTYSLGVNTSSPTGLIDMATGQAVVLSLNGSGVVEGRTAISGALVFTLSVDSATGGAVLDQLRAIQHESGTSVDTLNSANLITLTAAITDADGDLASATVNIGQSVSFYDDGPDVTDTNGVIKNEAGQSLAGLIDYDLGADGTGSVTLSYTGPALTSHGKSVVFSLEDTNSDGIKELVGKADLDGNGSLETTVLTLAVAGGDVTPEDGAYTLTLNDVIDLPVTRTTLLFDDISAGGGKDQLLVGTQLLIEDTNIADGNAQVKASSGFVGIDNNIMNTGETVVYKFADAVSGSSSPNYTITQKAVVNDVALKLFDTGSGSDSFTWTAYKNGVQVGTGNMTVADHQNFDFTNNLSGITETGSDTTSDGLIHVDGGYDQLNISVTSGNLKVGGVSYISVSNPEDLNLSFDYVATDADGDAISGSITTTVSATTATALSTAPVDINTLLHPDNNIQP